jgi:hypothetical protein
MSTEQRLTTIDTAGFFIGECMTEMERMIQISAEPVSPEQIERFNLARDRFWTNAARAKKEHASL